MDGLVVKIGNIYDVGNHIFLVFQVPSNKVTQNKTAAFSDVHSIVNCWPARINRYLARS